MKLRAIFRGKKMDLIKKEADKFSFFNFLGTWVRT
jgi:hypothetical protein